MTKLISVSGSLLLLASCTGDTFLQNIEEQRHLTPQANQSYGHKASNLMRLDEKLKEKASIDSIAPYTATVPAYAALSSEEVMGFLGPQEPSLWERLKSVFGQSAPASAIDLSARWKAIVTLAKTQGDDFLTPPVLEQLNLLRTDIRKAFTEGDASDRFLALYAKNPDLQNLLAQTLTQKWKLMVRSTGREDTSQLANAGGNESVANVSPTPKDLLDAAGVVVASYFSDKSLSQRREAGDDLSADPFVPVLFQRMIGENQERSATDNNAIPVGCVVYTEEPNARLRDVTLLQCAFGHNQGVVDNQVASDVFYVDMKDSTSTVYEVLSVKPQRVVASKEGSTLVAVNNPTALATAATLDKAAIKAIAQAVKNVEPLFTASIDVELVFERHTKTIHFVQARPLVASPIELKPSYIKSKNLFTAQNAQEVHVICPGNSEVQKITSADEVLFADSVDKGLRTLLASKQQTQKIKALIVKDASTVGVASHAVATLRRAGKVVLSTPNVSRLSKWLGDKHVALLIDTQQKWVVNMGSGPMPEIAEGFMTYPLPLKLSIAGGAAPASTSSASPYGQVKSNYEDKLTSLKQHALLSNQAKVKLDLAQINQGLQSDIENKTRLSRCQNIDCLADAYLARQALAQLEPLTVLALSQEKAILEAAVSPDALRRLFHIHFLEAMLLQDKAPVRQYSSLSIERDFASKQRLAQKNILPLLLGKEIGQGVLASAEAFDTSLMGVQEAATDKASRNWLKFNAKVFENNPSQEQLAYIKMVNTLASLDALPAWVNVNFKAEGTELGQLLGNFESQSTLLERIRLEQQKLASYNTSTMEDPAQFEQSLTMLRSFSGAMIDPFWAEFKKPLNDNNLTIKIAIVSLWEQLIEVYDQSIKALTGSTKYTRHSDQITNFQSATLLYFELLNKFMGAIQELLTERNSKYLAKCMDSIANANISDPKQMEPSQDFNVAGNLIDGPSRDYSGSPQTLEDYFTVAHQSLLGMIGRFNKDLLLDKVAMPAMMRTFAQTAASKLEEPELFIYGSGKGYEVVRLTLQEGTIALRLNVPMRNHSIMVDLTYDRNVPRYTLAMTYIRPLTRGQVAIDFGKMWALQTHGVVTKEDNGNNRAGFTIDLPIDISASSILDFVLYSRNSFKTPAWSLTDDSYNFLLRLNPAGFHKDFFELAKEAGVKSRSLELRYHLKLLKDKDMSHATNADREAGSLSVSEFQSSQWDVHELIGALLENRLSTKHIQHMLVRIASNAETNEHTLRSVLSHVNQLVQKDQMLDDAVPLAKAQSASSHNFIQDEAFKILGTTLKKGKGYDAAIEILGHTTWPTGKLANPYAYCGRLELMAGLLEVDHATAMIREILTQAPQLLSETHCYDLGKDAAIRIKKVLGEP